MVTNRPLRFGVFLAPYYRIGQNPTLCLDRELEFIKSLDSLGFDEVWLGEHHSGGWEIITSPEIFLTAAAERTRQIKLATGVIPVPYHHPLHVAERAILLDHLTKGRFILGMGPGALYHDSHLHGLDHDELRPGMCAAVETIARLMTEDRPFTVENKWFTIRDGYLQLRPWSRGGLPMAMVSIDSTEGLQLAGRFQMDLIYAGSINNLPERWQVVSASAKAANAQCSRKQLLSCVTVHLANSEQEARDNIRVGAAAERFDYWHGVLGHPEPPCSRHDWVDHQVEVSGWIVTTPEKCVTLMKERLEAMGELGGIILVEKGWADPTATRRSYELFSNYVIPQLNGMLHSLYLSRDMSKELHLTGKIEAA